MSSATSRAHPAPSETIGRFRVVRLLGRGSQGAVHLASDPVLNRLVAIKTLAAVDAAGREQAQRLLREARTASVLSHPNVVPVYEAGLDGPEPYVVFEYVEGCTLRQMIKTAGAMSVARAVVAMSQILAGVAHAHGKGLVHGDLTPANILFSAGDVPRVTDFGIARGLRDPDAQPAAGTVRYMAPEHFTGGGADQRTDVFALGLIFWEMLTGEPANRAGDDASAIYRVLREVIPKPSQRRAGIDPRLDDIVARALQKDPGARFQDAAAMKAELDKFRVPATDGGTMLLGTATTHSTVAFLLRRMRHKSNFPALSQRYAAINRLTREHSDASLPRLANLIMQDFALTQKLLQVVNSVGYAGNGRATNVSEAIVTLGMEQVRAIASGLMLAPPPQVHAAHPALPEVLLGAFIAAVVGRNAGRLSGLRNVEELFVCSMFSRLGEILSIYYLADDYDEIVRTARTMGVTELTASRSVLGIDFDQLGIEVAQQWNFPPNVLHAMKALPAGALPAPQTEREKIAHAAGFARELCDAAWRTRPEERTGVLLNLTWRFGASLPGASQHLTPLIEHSLELGLKYCAIAGVATHGSALIEGLRAWAQSPPPAPPVPTDAAAPAPDHAAAAESPPVARAKAGGIAPGWLRRLITRTG